MASSKPVIALLHGAFFAPVHYRRLIEPLRAQGYIVIAPSLPSTGLDDSAVGKTYVDDAKRVLEYLTPYLDEGKEAVVVAHSLGGIAASALAEGQTVEDRKAKGLRGGVKAVVYLTALAIPTKGASFLEILGSTPPIYIAEGPFYVLTEYAYSPDSAQLQIPKEDQIALSKTLVHQSRASLETPINSTATDVTASKTYIVCTEDQGVPAQFQENLGQSTGCRVVKIKAGHFPFLESEAKAKEVIDIIVDVAEK